MKTPIYYTEQEQEEIERFIVEESDIEFICHELTSEYVHSDVVVSSTSTTRDFNTMGMGAREMNTPHGMSANIEIFMYSSLNNEQEANSENMTICQQLVRLTKIPFRDNSWLGMFHTIDATEEFQNKFGYHGFCLLPTEHQIELSSGKTVFLLQALPVYQEEMEWLWKQGNDLDSIFDFISTIEDYYIENDLPFGAADVKRPAFVPDSQ